MKVKLGGKVTVSSQAEESIKMRLKCKLFNQWDYKKILAVNPHFSVSKWEDEFQKQCIFRNAFLFPPAHAVWVRQEKRTLKKSFSILGAWVLSSRLHNFRVSAKEKIQKKSNCPCVKENLSFRSLITANVIKSSYSIENEQKKSMENCLTDAEGSGWEVGDDKPCQQYVWEPVSFIVMQLQTSTWFFFNSELWGDLIYFLYNLLWLCKTVSLQALFPVPAC